MEELSFLFYISIPTLIFGYGYYLITDYRRNKLFREFEILRSETYQIESMEDLKVLEVKAMAWNNKIKLPSEQPWRTELFMLMREKRNYFKNTKI